MQISETYIISISWLLLHYRQVLIMITQQTKLIVIRVFKEGATKATRPYLSLKNKRSTNQVKGNNQQEKEHVQTLED